MPEKTLQPGDAGYVAPIADTTSAANNPDIQTTSVENQTPPIPATTAGATEAEANVIKNGPAGVEQPTNSPQTVDTTTGIETPSNTIGTEVVNAKPVVVDATGVKELSAEDKYALLLAAYVKLKHRSMLDVGYEKVLDAEAGL